MTTQLFIPKLDRYEQIPICWKVYFHLRQVMLLHQLVREMSSLYLHIELDISYCVIISLTYFDKISYSNAEELGGTFYISNLFLIGFAFQVFLLFF